MDSKLLMIGDWVYDKVIKSNARVDALQSLTIKCDIHALKHPSDDFEPVILTPEILEKNGFSPTLFNGEGVPIAKVYPLKSIVGGYRFENFFPTSIHICMNLIYVYELQHALRLCGLDDLADGFKI